MYEPFKEITDKLAAEPKTLMPWFDTHRAAPNEIFRSALFNCKNRNMERKYFKKAEIAVIGDGQIFYTGEELRQDDEKVWLQLLHLAKEQPLGSCVEFTPRSFVSSLDWSFCGQSYDKLKACISRMQVTGIQITSKRLRCTIGVSLVEKFKFTDAQNGASANWQVWINKEMYQLFDPDYTTRINWETRLALPDGIASKLFGYFSSHNEPYPVKLETLITLCGSELAPKHFKIKLKKALDTLVDANFLEDWSIDKNLVTVKRRL